MVTAPIILTYDLAALVGYGLHGLLLFCLQRSMLYPSRLFTPSPGSKIPPNGKQVRY